MDTTGITYKLSIEYICSKIGLVLHEIPDWNCCGATAAHSKNKMLALALPARNLAQAEEEGLDLDVAVPCASCYSRMKHTVVAGRNHWHALQSESGCTEFPGNLFQTGNETGVSGKNVPDFKRNESGLLLWLPYIQTGGSNRSFLYGKSNGNG